MGLGRYAPRAGPGFLVLGFPEPRPPRALRPSPAEGRGPALASRPLPSPRKPLLPVTHRLRGQRRLKPGALAWSLSAAPFSRRSEAFSAAGSVATWVSAEESQRSFSEEDGGGCIVHSQSSGCVCVCVRVCV